MGWAGKGLVLTPFDDMLQTALRRGQSRRGHREIRIEGERSCTHTFVGPYLHVQGTITCQYYGSDIFAVDFVNARVTNFGMWDYSMSTKQNMGGWEWAVTRAFPVALPRHVLARYRRWCFGTHQAKGPLARFLERVWWVHTDRSGNRWFEWEKYDAHAEALTDAFDTSNAFLRTDQNWRYFDYHWDDAGKWSRRFLGEDAVRRWQMRERKLAKKRAA